MLSKKEKGDIAEEKALDFLEKKGFTLWQKNYRYKKGEIDLIVSKDNLLVFVEVRSLASVAFGFPEQTISTKKKQLLLQTAEQFIIEHNWLKNIRFDIIAINKENIEHFEDAITHTQ